MPFIPAAASCGVLRLKIKGVMEKDGFYDFAAVGAKRDLCHPKGNRGRR